MTNEKVLLVGGEHSAKFDRPLRESGWSVSRVNSFAAAEDLREFGVVIADATALRECEDEGPWGPDKPSPRPALVVTLQGNDEIPEWSRKHIAGCLAQEIAQLSTVLQGMVTRTREQALSRWGTRALDCPELIGASPAVDGLRQTLRNLSRTRAAVIIAGEPGADKAGVAISLHRQSPWAEEVLWEVDCAGPAEAIEAELGGEKLSPVRGDRVGAGRDVGAPGLRLVGRGTVVLHEVGRLRADAQEKLMKLLCAEDFEGRIIATTSCDLEKACKAGSFREDLFYRLNMGLGAICPLRERKADLPELAEYFRNRNGCEYGSQAVAFSPAALEALEGYGWPGNVAELGHVIGRALILASGQSLIEPVHLRLSVETGPDTDATLPLEEVERRHIFRVLERCQWNRTHAAARLGISIRTLRNKLREYRMAEAPEEKAA